MSIPVPSYIVEMSRAEELFPLNAKNPSPWETCRTHFIKRSLICLVLTILLALGSSALACYAVLNHNWCILGISLSITISSILIALLLAFPIKNKVYGITLIDEISQDINNVGAQTLQSFEEVFKQLHHTQLPELKELHLSLVEKRQKNTQKQNKIKDLQKTLGSFPLTTYTQVSPLPTPAAPSPAPLPKKTEVSKSPPSQSPSSVSQSSEASTSSPKSTSSPSPTKVPSPSSAPEPQPLPTPLPPTPSPEPSYNPPPLPMGGQSFQTQKILEKTSPLDFSDLEDSEDGLLQFDDDTFLEDGEGAAATRRRLSFNIEKPTGGYANSGFLKTSCNKVLSMFKKGGKN